jgi:hypothetical protein
VTITRLLPVLLGALSKKQHALGAEPIIPESQMYRGMQTFYMEGAKTSITNNHEVFKIIPATQLEKKTQKNEM